MEANALMSRGDQRPEAGRLAWPDYRRRVIDDELDELLTGLPAIALDGAKGVGKTSTARQRANTQFRLDNPAEMTLLRADPERLGTADAPVLVDEWQHWASVWDFVRRAVDANPSPGRFLLTGSAVPLGHPVHSGAGRIVTRRMRPLSLAERDLVSPTVSLSKMLQSDPPIAIDGESPIGLAEYVHEILASGFPAIHPLSQRVRNALLDGYLDALVQKDFPQQGHDVRVPQTLKTWLAAYAAATSSTAAYSVILDAATPADASKPAKTTTQAYRAVLEQLWLLDPVPGWVPSNNPFSRLTQRPKHHLADTALAARLLRASERTLLSTGGAPGDVLPRDGTLLGALFESLVTLSVKTYAQHAQAETFHLRTAGQREVDLIVEGEDQRIVALEVKLDGEVQAEDVKHLHWLREMIGDRLADAAVITTGRFAYRRPDGIAVVPAALLGP
ncbi:ATPase AAA [Kineosporia sp. NBRC 101677]|nr:ATPase AAA [Kineosporia sp. NBRC 101677]